MSGPATDDIYAAMDWLRERQDDIEKELAARHLAEGGIAMFDQSSSWVEGRHCELAAYGYSRDGKRGKPQIEYGLLTDHEGRPVAVRVFAGNTADPKAFPEAVTAVREKFALEKMIMVGDRGMITSARIKDLRELEGMAWITCLRHPAIKKLMADGGPLQLSLFDEQDLAEITSGDFPGERLIACRNPYEARKRARTREELLAATEADLGKVAAQVAAGRVKDPDKIGIRAGKVISKRKVAKHFILDIGQQRITWRRNQASIDTEALTDGIYVIRTPVPAQTLDAAGAVAAYKDLARLERDFRHLKADDLDLRPIWHRLEERVPSPRADLHARLLPHLAPAPGLGTADLQRRAPPGPRQPRRPGPPVNILKPRPSSALRRVHPIMQMRMAETELRRAMKMPVGSIPARWHSARLALVAQALTAMAGRHRRPDSHRRGAPLAPQPRTAGRRGHRGGAARAGRSQDRDRGPASRRARHHHARAGHRRHAGGRLGGTQGGSFSRLISGTGLRTPERDPHLYHLTTR